MLNYIWLGLVVAAVLIGGYHNLTGATSGTLKEATEGAFTMAETAVMKIALPLVGIMALWLGVMRLAERAGLIQVMARALRPVMRRLFPDVPPEHPAIANTPSESTVRTVERKFANMGSSPYGRDP